MVATDIWLMSTKLLPASRSIDAMIMDTRATPLLLLLLLLFHAKNASVLLSLLLPIDIGETRAQIAI
jgi:hypothetical protein